VGNKNRDASGKKRPTTEGPRIIPATISPITVGWPILLKMNPKKRDTKIMEMI
jgi:hypothetical protein